MLSSREEKNNTKTVYWMQEKFLDLSYKYKLGRKNRERTCKEGLINLNSKRSSLLTFLQESKRSFCIVGNKNYIFCTKGEINSKIKTTEKNYLREKRADVKNICK